MSKLYHKQEVSVSMPRQGIFLSIIFLLTVFLTCPSHAGQQTLGDERVLVRFDGLLQNSAREILMLYPAIRAELLKDLGWETDFRPEIVLIKDSASFRKFAGSDLVTAVAISQKDLIVIDYSRMGMHPFTLGTTLKHELCHLELHHHIGEGRLPRWLDEGICQWVTGGFAEIMTEGNRSMLRAAILSNRLMSIDSLAEKFPSDGRGILLAYEESKSIVEYIKKVFGVSAVRGMLENMSRGDDLENAVRKSLLISQDELEKRWRSSLTEKNSWLSYFRDNLYEALFLFAAMITICGFLKVLKRYREYKDDEEEEDIGES
jgi:hypothetical protein